MDLPESATPQTDPELAPSADSAASEPGAALPARSLRPANREPSGLAPGALLAGSPSLPEVSKPTGLRDARGRRLIPVTVPLVPEFGELERGLRDVLDRRWLTNQGHYADQLTARLMREMEAPALSLVSSGTQAVELMLRAGMPPGEVLVPSFSFPATWNLLCRDSRWKPVFVDIGDDYCLDPAAVERAITSRTSGILAVHTYGQPCHVDALEALAERHDLRLFFDAAHAFGVGIDGPPLAQRGDASAWSFHATKVFNTVEGGAVTGTRCDLIAAVDRERNFGFGGPDGQASFGTNAKIDEYRCVHGLAVLPLVRAAIARRLEVAATYLANLAPLEARGCVLPRHLFEPTSWRPNGAYFPIRFPESSGLTCEQALQALSQVGVLPRRYFDDRPFRSQLYAPFLRSEDTPRAAEFSKQVLCLPIHHELSQDDLALICETLGALAD